MTLNALTLLQQFLILLAGLSLFVSFILIAQPRLVAAIHSFAWQGVLVSALTLTAAMTNQAPPLYFSAGLTLVLKGLFIPWLLHRLALRLGLEGHSETLRWPELVLLAGVFLVIFSYWLVEPMVERELIFTRNIIAVSLAVVLLGFLMMVFRTQAVAQVLGFMSMENGLFLAAVSATTGMPMVVELGVAFDVLVAAVLFGVFFFQIRESIDSLDVDRLNRLAETPDVEPMLSEEIGE